MSHTMGRMILFAAVMFFIQITGSRPTAVTVTDQTGHDITLEVHKAYLSKDIIHFVWSFENVPFAYLIPKVGLTVSPRYTGRVEIFDGYSVKLNNIQHTDSGLYVAEVYSKCQVVKTLAEYEVIVQDPVSPVVLTVDSVSSSSDSCNLTVSCRTHDSDISSTLTCDTQTCSQEGGERSKVTTTGASLRVSMVNDYIICGHSNQVTSIAYRETTQTLLDICLNYTAPTIVTPPGDVYNVSGSQVYLSCEAVGVPTPVLTWRKVISGKKMELLPGDGGNLAIQTRVGPEKHEVTGWVLIAPLTSEEAGSYECHATNVKGEASAVGAVHLVESVDDIIMETAHKRRVYVFIIVGVVVASLIVIVPAAVFCLVKKREWRGRLLHTREPIYTRGHQGGGIQVALMEREQIVSATQTVT